MFEGIEKIDDFRWRIPKSFKPGMRVPGVIYASEKMLESIFQDRAAEQVANVACLPGIVKHSLAMPDIHWGYGFCLTKDAKILTDFGYYKAIIDFEKDWASQVLKSIDLQSKKTIRTPVVRFIKLEPKRIFTVTTKEGYKIKGTKDHPLFTPSGMKSIGKLSDGEKIAIFPFEGIPYKKPTSQVIISEKDIRKTLLKIGRKPNTPRFEINIQKLKERNLLHLTYSHSKLPYILKIMGFVFGDGSMNFIGKRGDGIVHFSGKPEDLEEVRKDVKALGYTPSPIHYYKTRSTRADDRYHDSYSFCINASSLVILLETLGVPRGVKVSQPYRVPSWIFKAPLWQKRLFLASLFGCELRIPHRRLKRRGYFNAPSFPMSKKEALIKNGKLFLNDIKRLLKEFGVNILYIDQRRRYQNKKGEITWALELIISPIPKNLLNLWSKVGFEYNSERSFKANAAVQYLRFRQRIIEEKDEAIKVHIPQLLKEGLSYQKVALQLAGNPLTRRFIIDICWKLNKGRSVIPRIPFSFPSFEDYAKKLTLGLGKSGMVWDEINTIEETAYQDPVYDFTVEHSDHNFIANNFIVSNCIGGVAATDINADGIISPCGVGFDINCGMRLIRSNLTAKDLSHDKINDLVWALYNNIPAGIGSSGDINLKGADQRKILTAGAQWAVKQGYGVKEDIEYTEERGMMEGADSEVVSERAYKRGKKQIGTLGSGNHFLEVQVVDEIYDEYTAGVFGLEKGTVTIMLHCGSRGFGYQICDDYSRQMVEVSRKYNIDLPDRQLACAPFTSPEGQAYFSAMKCAANYGWANRQVIMHLVRLTCEKFFGEAWTKLGLNLIYDVTHNIAKVETHVVDGDKKKLCVHRKGATRAFGPGHPNLPAKYKSIGQPVIIPGDMGTNSYLLTGTEKAAETFYSTSHGAGRVMSRKAAVNKLRGRDIARELEEKGIFVRSAGRSTLAEEAPEAYKNIHDVVDVVHQAGISKKICRLKPLGVIKG